MTVPVLIPARNEEAHIAITLTSLPEEAEPFVIPNGCTDDTAAIAEGFGATVLDGSPEGKLPALQLAINHLGERALEPFVSLDADSHPVSPDEWLGALLSARAELDPQQPAIITGSHVYEGLNLVRLIFKNLRYKRDIRKYSANPNFAISGANMLFDLQTEEVVRAVQELPNIWPLEDKALRDVVTEHSGNVSNTIRPEARVVTDASDRAPSLFGKYLRRNSPTLMDTYSADAAPGAISYWDFRPMF